MLGHLTDLTAPWGTVYSFGYDGEGRRTSLTSTSGRNSSMGYTNGQLTAIVDNLDPSKSDAISYDALNRLVGYSSPTTATYAYDAMDRRIARPWMVLRLGLFTTFGVWVARLMRCCWTLLAGA